MTNRDNRPARRAASLLLLALAALALARPALAEPSRGHDDARDDEGDRRPYAIGLWGDLPYSDLQATAGVPNLIADMNAQDLAFTVQDGDLKAGNGTPGSVTPTTCTDALYVQALGFFNALRAPAVLTPGDNDWTDCDRPSNGGFNSLERLDHERKVLFATPFSLGQRRMKQEVQSAPLCLGPNGPAPCVENRRWHLGGVTYATLNMQGSCNNLCDTAPDPAEWAARNAANIAWLRETFAEAARRRSAAVMLVSQANPGWDLTDGTRAPLRDPKTLAETDGQPDGYQQFLAALRDEVVAFRRPVAYVHGDSHYFRVDKPFLDARGRRLENFTRVETFGDNQANGNNDVHWVKVAVDADSRDVFGFRHEAVVRVPASALFPSGTAEAVFVVQEGRARLAPVEVVGRSAGLAAPARGLEPGVRVVVHPGDASPTACASRHDDGAPSRLRARRDAHGPGRLTTKTAQGAVLTTVSATEPSTTCFNPVRPCVATTARSKRRSPAVRTITSRAAP